MGNKFPASEISKLAIYKKLECISIGDNQINSINDLKPLTKLEGIVQLDFNGTPFSETKNYRKEVFENFTKLLILDNKDKDGLSYDFGSQYEDTENQEEDDGINDGEEDQSYEDVDQESGENSVDKKNNNKYEDEGED